MIAERVRLHRPQQQASGSVQSYFDVLKQIAANCQFPGAEYDSRLRDIFVAGLREDQILQKF